MIAIYLHPSLPAFPRTLFHPSDDAFSILEQCSTICGRPRLPRHRRFLSWLVRGLRPAARGSPSASPRTECGFLRCALFVSIIYPARLWHLLFGSQERRCGGYRIPPNMSKVFYHWGLEERVRKLCFKSNMVLFNRCESS
jgi:hypothetical protein